MLHRSPTPLEVLMIPMIRIPLFVALGAHGGAVRSEQLVFDGVDRPGPASSCRFFSLHSGTWKPLEADGHAPSALCVITNPCSKGFEHKSIQISNLNLFCFVLSLEPQNI